jgi:signal peptidase I
VPDQLPPSLSPGDGDPVGDRPATVVSSSGSADLHPRPAHARPPIGGPGGPGGPAGPGGAGGPGDGAGGSNGAGAHAGGDDLLPLPPEPEKPRNRFRSYIEWALVIGGALLVALLVRTVFIQAFWIPSDSMEPTLHKGDRVLVNKLSYKLHDVHRGDVIVFKRPEAARSANPDDDIEDLIKRVVGLPGDTLKTVDGRVYVNDEPLPEPYLPEGTTTLMPSGQDMPPTEVPEGMYFMMGDNRGNSQDSRFFGPIDEDLIVGRAFVRIYPLDDIGGL